jgi:hypothetical protein
VRAALYEIPAFQRGGSIVVAFETAGTTLKETNDMSPFSLLVALDCHMKPISKAKVQ